MRCNNILALVCVLFLTCCDGFHTDTHAYQENDKFEINTIGHEANRHLRSINDADYSEGALNHGTAESKKHRTEHQEPTDTSTRSAKKIAAISKIMRAVEKSSVFKQLSTYAKKNPKKFRNTLAELQKTTGYKNLEKRMGKDPLLAMKDFNRANGIVESRNGAGMAWQLGMAVGLLGCVGVMIYLIPPL